MTKAENTIGLLLMAYGSPDSVEELEPYLLDIRGGRPMTPGLLEEITERYKLIGGRSPLLDLTRLQAAALEAELNRRLAGSGRQVRAYVGMRHWQPRIKQAVAEMTDDGIQRVVAIVMAPHSSRMSTGAYFARLDEAIADLGVDLKVDRVESWHDHPGLIEAIAEKAEAALSRFEGVSPYVVFSAHSLPTRILDYGDPYDRQLKETASLLAQRLELEDGRWCFSYQSAGQSSETWLGPAIEQKVADLADAGEANLLVVPIGFVCDHVEVLYDVDINARQIAAAHGARLERSDSLNDSPALARTLADIVQIILDAEPAGAPVNPAESLSN